MLESSESVIEPTNVGDPREVSDTRKRFSVMPVIIFDGREGLERLPCALKLV